MAVTCPNKSSKEWLDLVKEFGEIKAMYLFTLNNEVIPTINEGNRLLGIIPDNVIVTPEGSFELNEAQAEQYKEMIDKYGKARATELIIDFIDLNDLRKYNVDPGSKAYSLAKPNEVNYNFKSIQKILDNKQKVDQWSKQIKDINKLLDKIQKDLGIPKDQIDLIRESDGNTIDDKLTNFIASYSYSVEINTSKEKVPKGFRSEEEAVYEQFRDPDFYQDEETGNIRMFESATPDWENAEEKPSSHYSNLTVPGGTNYTENEIATPLITPSIKGHAQFSTDNGIGWFRSDEQMISEYPVSTGTNVIERNGKWVVTAPEIGDIDSFDTREEAFKFLNSETTKTRRILEVQSDLFQKGREHKKLTGEDERVGDSLDDLLGTTGKKEFDSNGNQFLQLLNKDNNWVTFFIKSIVQDSAKKGYEKVLFPKGETAAKIEGHETIADEINNINETINSLNVVINPEWQDKSIKEYAEEYIEKNKSGNYSVRRIIQRGGGVMGMYYDVSVPTLEEAFEIFKNRFIPEIPKKYKANRNIGMGGFFDTKEEAEQENNKYKKELEQRKQELKSQGIEKLKPIEAFYEIKVGNILKKNYNVKEVTDEYGNSWLEVSLSEKDLSPVMLNKVRPSDLGKARAELEHKGFAAKDVDDITKIIDLLHTGKITKETYITTMQHSYGVAPDSSTRMFEKFEMLRKFVPFEIEMILDDTLPDFGEYDRKTRIIKINPIIASEDTVGHEMGHVLLELMGGMSNTTIRKVRESLKGTDLETEILNTYKDYYSSQQMLDLEVVAAAIGLDSNKIFNNPKLIEQYETWLMRLYRFIKELFGIDRGNVRKLTMMMFQSTPVENNYTKFYEYSKKYDRMLEDLNPAKRKAKKQPRPTLAEEYGQPTEAELDTLESFRNRATELMERKINTYRKSSKIIASKEAIDFLEKIKSAESPEQALYNFLSIAHKSTREIHLEYQFAVRKAENMRTPVTAKDLNRWKNYIDGFGMINDMLTVLKPELKTLRFKDPDRVKSDKEELFTDKTFAIMQDIIDKRNDIIKYYTTKGEEILLDFLEPHYNLIEIRRKEELEREYNKLATEQKNKETVDEYISRKLVEEKDRIKAWTQRSLKKELLEARGDINILTRWLDTIVDSRDPIVSAMVKAFTTADFNTHRDTIELRNEMVDIIRELEDFYNAKGIGFTDTKKMYDFMLEKNAEGKYTGNILRNVRSEYWKERNDKLKELQNRNATKAEINKFKKEWNKLNIRKFDKVKFVEDHLAFLNRLHDQKKISKAEIEEIMDNESRKGTPIYFQAVETQTIIRRPDVREEWNEWMAENVSKYITYISKWDNPEYAKLERILKDTNDPRTKFYNFVTQGIYKYGKAIPYSQRLYYRLPAMEKDTAERMQEGSWGKGLKERAKRAVTRTTSAEETIEEQFTAKAELVNEEGDPTLFMPIYYTNPIQDESGVMLDDKSTDLGMLYFNYFRMAIDYKHKSEILPSMELARYFITNRRYLKRDSDGHVIKDALDPERKRDITTGGNKSKLAEQLNDWFEAVFYGLRYKDEGLIGGTNINKAKVLDTINKYTAVNMLGLNFVQGIANLALGKATNFIESFGGINYNPKDFAYAEMYYTKNLPLTLGDVGSRKPNSVVNLLNDQFDSLNEYEDGKMKNNTRFKRLFTSSTLFFTSHAGEHMIQSQVLLAMLHNKKAIDSQGNILGNILDFYKAKDGKLIFNDNKNNIVNWTLKDQKDFMFRMKRVLADLHGDYYHNSIPAFQRLALGRWAGLFRKFIVPGFKRRWSGKHEDALRDTTVEGYYLTFGRFAGKFIKDIATMKMDLATEDWSTLTRSEKANIYRTLGDLAFLIAAITLGIVFTNMKGDGDDEDEWLISFCAYQSYRFLNEISFFILPNSFLNIMRSPAASMAIVENLFKFLAQLLDVVDGPFERFDSGPWERHLKLEKHITNFIPGYKQYYRLRDIDDSVSWWKN